MILFLRFLHSFSFDWEDISNTVFDHILKHLEVRQKYSAARCVLNSLLGVWKCGQTQSFVVDILHPIWTMLFGGPAVLSNLPPLNSLSHFISRQIPLKFRAISAKIIY